MDRFLLPGTVKQGYLTKSPPLDKGTSVFKAWKKRWCILYLSQRELFIQYYDNEDSARGSSPPKSTVSLRFCEKVDVDLDHSHYKNVFGIHLPERVYYFSAPSNFEMNEWVDAICAHLNLRDHSEVTNNLYTINSSPHTMPNQLNSSPPAIPIRSVSPLMFPSQYGTLSPLHMGSGISTYGSVPGRGPPPTPPPPYSGNQTLSGTNGTDILQPHNRHFTPSPNLSIQSRTLPPIPNSMPSSSSYPSLHSQDIPPNVPPRRQHNGDVEIPPVPPPRNTSSPRAGIRNSNIHY